MKVARFLLAGALLTLPLAGLAAKPVSIVFESNGSTASGTPYARYAVKCSNGDRAPLTAWDNRDRWCVGDETSEDCYSKQIKAAKAACKATRD
jgi:hypothetical protein